MHLMTWLSVCHVVSECYVEMRRVVKMTQNIIRLYAVANINVVCFAASNLHDVFSLPVSVVLLYMDVATFAWRNWDPVEIPGTCVEDVASFIQCMNWPVTGIVGINRNLRTAFYVVRVTDQYFKSNHKERRCWIRKSWFKVKIDSFDELESLSRCLDLFGYLIALSRVNGT